MNELAIDKIKQWLKLENEIKLLNLESRKRKVEKKQLTDEVMNIMKNNEIDCIDTSGGKILYKKSETKKPLNKKSLEQILKKYYQDKHEKAEEICNFILDNRETKTNESIKLKQNKS